MDRDFRDIPTQQLAHETIQRGREVYSINHRAWETCGDAFISGCYLIFVVAIGVIFLATIGPLSLIFSGPLVFAAAAWLWWPQYTAYRQALRDCESFASEMEARRLELERRNPKDGPDGTLGNQIFR